MQQSIPYDRLGRARRQIAAVEANRTRAQRRLETRYRAQQRRFAGAVRAEDRNQFARLYVDRNAVQDG